MQSKTPLPQPPSVAEATEAVQLATQALDSALMDGDDATQARLALHAAEVLLQGLQAQQREADEAAAGAARAVVHQAEAAATQQVQKTFEEAISVIESVEGIDAPEPVVPAQVINAAHDLSRKQMALAEAEKPHAAARAARDLVTDRIAPKQAELAAIAERRADGDEQPTDAAQVSLLEQDLARLRLKLAPLDAQVAVAAEVVAQHRALVADAETALQAAQVKADLDAMTAHVRVLEATFVARVRALRLAAQARGMRNFGSTYLPSQALRNVAHGVWV